MGRSVELPAQTGGERGRDDVGEPGKERALACRGVRGSGGVGVRKGFEMGRAHAGGVACRPALAPILATATSRIRCPPHLCLPLLPPTLSPTLT